MVRRAQVLRLSSSGFRNLQAGQLTPASRLNLISGENGQGKTSLIEALYVAATTRSFRASQLKEVVQLGEAQAQVQAQVLSYDLERSLRAQLSQRGRSFLLDGKRPKRSSDYATALPIVVFHPGEIHLASGPAAGRRRLLDRILLYLDPTGTEARLRYQQAMKDRTYLLGRGVLQGAELDAYEALAARFGARFSQARRRAVEALARELSVSFQKMAAEDLELSIEYLPGGSEDEAEFAIALQKERRVDALRKRAGYGPQRDDIDLCLNGSSARKYASQGQQRVLALSMKMGELALIRDVVEMEPILLLDDVSSELDSARTQSVFSYLQERQNQIFVTTTRPELFSELFRAEKEAAHFRVHAGVISPGSAPE